MKLSKIYKRTNLYTLLAVLIIGSISHYLIFTSSVHRSSDEILTEYKNNIEKYVVEHDTLIHFSNLELHHNRFTFKEIPTNIIIYPIFKDSLLFNEYEGQFNDFRVLQFSLQNKGKNYLITLCQPTLDAEDLFFAVLTSLVVLFLIFLLLSVFSTQWFINIIWKPFSKTLEQLREYDITCTTHFQYKKSDVDEFNELNQIIDRMVSKIHEDYTSLKILTENTSHEIQTPLAIIKTKIELLQQTEIYNEKKLHIIQAIDSAVNRASRINRLMLLIAKINNDQYIAKTHVDINLVIDHLLESCEDLMQNKNISIRKNYLSHFTPFLHEVLAENLVQNLLTNAIRYNTQNGEMEIYTDSDTLRISNTHNNTLPAGNLFDRFIKSGTQKEATGLGLSIVKSICVKNRMEVTAHYDERLFHITVRLIRL